MSVYLHWCHNSRWRVFRTPPGFERTIYIDFWRFQLVIELDRGYGDD